MDGLSICIPVYNYNILSLVTELQKQCYDYNIEFEILAFDDGSKSDLNFKNNQINSLNGCVFKELPNNIGRSSIRNLLARQTKYDLLLFLDADVFPFKNTFIKDYLRFNTCQVISGGLKQTKIPPEKPFKLRWLYTKKRESEALCSSNFLIKKDVFLSFPFDESLKKYGYEDVIFFNTLMNNNIRIKKIKNPIEHYGNDASNVFIKKTENALENLIELIEVKKIEIDQIKISKYYYILNKIKIQKAFLFFYKKARMLLLKNFNSNHPSILLFDLYRLGYFCSLKNKK